MKEKRMLEERVSYGWSKDSVRLIMTPSSVAKSTYFYVQECGYFQTDRTYFTERKNLNSFLIIYTISGQGLLTYDDNTYCLTDGSCFYINCMEHSHYRTAPGCTWEFLWVHFQGVSALGYYEEFVRNGFQIVQIQDKSSMERNFRRMISLNQKRNVSTEVLSSNLITNILTELLLHTIQKNAGDFYMPEYLKKVLKDIDQNFRTDLSLDGLAERYGVSKFHLSKEFKKYIGSTLNEYIITARISYAKELLKYSNESVNEIAFLSGMNHVSHFINLFKARESMTPLTYRKEWRMN